MREEEERWGGGEGQLALYTMLCETGAKGEFKISSNPSDNAMTHVSLTYGQTRNEREQTTSSARKKTLGGLSHISADLQARWRDGALPELHLRLRITTIFPTEVQCHS